MFNLAQLSCNSSPHVFATVPTDEERAEEREETGWKLVHAVGPDEGFHRFVFVVINLCVTHLEFFPLHLIPGCVSTTYSVSHALLCGSGDWCSGEVPTVHIYIFLFLIYCERWGVTYSSVCEYVVSPKCCTYTYSSSE